MFAPKPSPSLPIILTKHPRHAFLFPSPVEPQGSTIVLLPLRARQTGQTDEVDRGDEEERLQQKQSRRLVGARSTSENLEHIKYPREDQARNNRNPNFGGNVTAAVVPVVV